MFETESIVLFALKFSQLLMKLERKVRPTSMKTFSAKLKS